MIKYTTATQAWFSMLGRLFNQPPQSSRRGAVRELVGVSFTVTDPSACWIPLRETAHLGYGYAELLWYLSGQQNIEMLKNYAPSYEAFTNGGLAMGAYGHRIFNNPGIASRTKNGSLRCVFELLKKDPDDRRAVVALWDSGDVFEAIRGEWKDYPCTLSLQFLIRNGALHMITTMRSNDIWIGGLYDIFAFCHIQMILASAMNLRLGEYHHQAGSLHLYEKNRESARGILLDTRIQSIRDSRTMPAPDQAEAEMLIMDYANSITNSIELAACHCQQEIAGIRDDTPWGNSVRINLTNQRKRILAKESKQ